MLVKPENFADISFANTTDIFNRAVPEDVVVLLLELRKFFAVFPEGTDGVLDESLSALNARLLQIREALGHVTTDACL